MCPLTNMLYTKPQWAKYQSKIVKIPTSTNIFHPISPSRSPRWHLPAVESRRASGTAWGTACAIGSHGRKGWCHPVGHASPAMGIAAVGHASAIQGFCLTGILFLAKTGWNSQTIGHLDIFRYQIHPNPPFGEVKVNSTHPVCWVSKPPTSLLTHTYCQLLWLVRSPCTERPIVWVEVKAAPNTGRTTADVGFGVHHLAEWSTNTGWNGWSFC